MCPFYLVEDRFLDRHKLYSKNIQIQHLASSKICMKILSFKKLTLVYIPLKKNT